MLRRNVRSDHRYNRGQAVPIQKTKAMTISDECPRIRRFEIKIHDTAAIWKAQPGRHEGILFAANSNILVLNADNPRDAVGHYLKIITLVWKRFAVASGRKPAR
jgi:hypothetical protein